MSQSCKAQWPETIDDAIRILDEVLSDRDKEVIKKKNRNDLSLLHSSLGRGETVAEKPSFRSAFKSRRCLIPASGFYEWQTVNRVKQPWYVSLRSGEPMAFAGLWETWHLKDGEPIETCCIITTAGNELMQPIHDRMPVILNPGQCAAWLSINEHNPDNLLPLINPHESESMQAWPVTRELNKVGVRNDAGLTDPLPPTSLFD